MPKVSIIIPIYNVEQYLRNCLESILNQTFSDFEVLCVNDGAKDSSRDILQEYADKDSRIKIYDQANGGAYTARNRALDLVCGEYIQFVDADDAIEPQLLEVAVGRLEQEQADMAYFSWMSPRAYENKVTGEMLDLTAIGSHLVGDALESTFTQQLPHLGMSWYKMYRADFIKGIRFIKGRTYEDLHFTWEVLIRRPRAVVIDAQLYHYTLNPASLTGVRPRIIDIEELHEVLCRVYQLFIGAGMAKEAEKFVRMQAYYMLSYQFGLLKEADPDSKDGLNQRFALELQDLRAKGILGVRSLWPHGLFEHAKNGGSAKSGITAYLRGVSVYTRSLLFLFKHS